MRHSNPRRQPLVYWNPRHDQVVMLHLYGMTNQQIADTVGYSTDNVRIILNDPRSQRAKEVLRQRILGGAMMSIEEKMGGLAIKALKNIEKTIDADIDVGARGKKHQDDVSFELLARVGFGRKDSSKDEGGGIHLPKEEAQQLVAAIEKANHARQIIVEAEVAEVIEVESSELERDNGSGLD